LRENRRLIHQAAFFRLAAKKLRFNRSFEAVEKLRFSSSLSIETTLSIES
jgi:hypothetical protein